LKYILALDLSLSSTGAVVFSENGKHKEIITIETSPNDETPIRLKIIANRLKKIKKQYDIKTVVIERGFTRFNTSTQQIFRCHGIANYIFAGIPQIYYSSKSIRKIVLGNGNAKKEEVRDFILKKYKKIKFKNMDETDAMSIGLCFFMDEENIKK